MRGRLAAALVSLVGVTVVFGFLGLAWHWATFAEIKELILTVLTPLVALAGTAVGFYFGVKDR